MAESVSPPLDSRLRENDSNITPEQWAARARKAEVCAHFGCNLRPVYFYDRRRGLWYCGFHKSERSA